MLTRNRIDTDARQNAIQLTPMIDIVFQLLVFFVLTFRVVSQEGDFHVQMPKTQPERNLRLDTPIVHVRLKSAADGGLAAIEVNNAIRIDDWEMLRDIVAGVVEDDGGPGLQETSVVLDCDYQLRYEHAVDALTAVSGYRDGDDIVHLVDRVSFAPPRTPMNSN